MAFYDPGRATAAHEAVLRQALHGLDRLPPATAARVVRAWSVSWGNSSFAALGEIPVSPDLDYPLLRHVNDVTRTGLALADTVATGWEQRADRDALLCILILHDVDKPMLFEHAEGACRPAALATTVPHGVLGALLLAELGFPDLVVSTVATHATDAPFHGGTPEAFLLHYADMVSFDAAAMECGVTPFYRRQPQLRPGGR